ncbi:M23 family metallopeptidase [Oerskovia merdavium]|uniref:M23 family metallopeptidase n=1 Tax=Oerskovia merdavium TaxID=2762227 RepID=A0ABR8TWJ7_9CELL|nr:M23 family metallopeptidase [Oerskovia merdavium]MBD7980152.1 M23 family metallopeptidase [Oerskovia merdavium]
MTEAVLLALPFRDRWLVQNSPARRVPSHGVDLLGERYAIDFVGVDARHRTAAVRDWRTLLATEPPERFVAFGRPILAPAGGVVVQVHDGEHDHEARRSQPALVPYALGAAGRLREGVHAVAGNHVTIALPGARAFVSLVHLRRGTVQVTVGDDVHVGQQLAECGNSGNSTQPHVHVQVADNLDLTVAQGVPVAFRDFREWLRGRGEPLDRATGLPGERSVVEPLPVAEA